MITLVSPSSFAPEAKELTPYGLRKKAALNTWQISNSDQLRSAFQSRAFHGDVIVVFAPKIPDINQPYFEGIHPQAIIYKAEHDLEHLEGDDLVLLAESVQSTYESIVSAQQRIEQLRPEKQKLVKQLIEEKSRKNLPEEFSFIADLIEQKRLADKYDAGKRVDY